MPSPGSNAIAAIIGAKTYTVEGGFDTQFKVDSVFVQKLSSALDSGWTSASPTTSTDMASAFSNELSTYLTGQGMHFLSCIASSIDSEIAAWVASWDINQQIHTHTVSASNIVTRIESCAPFWSNGSQALAQVSADAFMSGFGQEEG